MRLIFVACAVAILLVRGASAADAPPARTLRPEEQVRARIIERKLEDWKIKKVAFNEATLDEALAFFKAEAKRLDPEQKGLNFVVSPAAQSASADGRVTLTLDEVPISVALKYTVEMLRLTYRVDPFVVMIDRAAAGP